MPAISVLDPRCGLVIEAEGKSLQDIETTEARNWLTTHGAVLFRGFAPSVESFVGFTEKFLTQALVHGAPGRRRITDDDTVNEVTPGTQDVDFHAEMAMTPRRPDLLWFYCVRPAAAGGETTICDGVRVFQALGPETQARFLENPLRYTCHVYPDRMKRLYPELSFEDAVKRRMQEAPEFTFRMTDAGAEVDYVTSAISKTRWGAAPAFANSITGPYEGIKKWQGFVTGDAISNEIMAEIRAATEQEKVLVPWQTGDLVLIDNSRVMHGRRSFTGERSIYVRMGRANW